MADVFGSVQNNNLIPVNTQAPFFMNDQGYQNQMYLQDIEVKLDTSMVQPLKTNQIRPTKMGFQSITKPMPDGRVENFYHPVRAFAKSAPKAYLG